MNTAQITVVRVPFRPMRVAAEIAWRLAAGVAQWLEMQRDLRQLNAMSDSELKDIGLHRAQVEFAARRGMTEGFDDRG
ncbi:MAG: DUF1127 domain-containing protein [Pseudomonadota bacterium]|nr:DUF1127 domain-containing protein [Pseudomonadota bacterium]